MTILHVMTWLGKPFNGGTLFKYNFCHGLENYAEQGFVFLMTNDQKMHDVDSELLDLGIRSAYTCNCKISTSISLKERLQGIFFSQLPPSIFALSRKNQEIIVDAVKKAENSFHPDIVVIWSVDYASICANVISAHKVLFACDSMQLVNRSIAEQTNNRFSAWYHLFTAKRLEKYVKVYYHLYEKVLYVSSRDAEADLKTCPQLDPAVIPLGVDSTKFIPSSTHIPHKKRLFIFHGLLSYPPNADALKWIYKTLGPQLAEIYGEDGFTIRIIGKNAPAEMTENANLPPWFELTGYVENLTSALNEADYYVAPLNMGGGMKNKILEALSCGLPIIGTSEAFSAISVIDGIHAVIAKREDFAVKIQNLEKSPELAGKLRKNARKWICDNVDLGKNVKLLYDTLESLAVKHN